MLLKLSTTRLTELFASISADRALYLPIEKNGQVQCGRWAADEKVCLDSLNTVKSAKDLFFPQSENLIAFKTQGKNISIIDNRDQGEAFAIFGVRACDAAGFAVLDKVFLSEPVDTYYKKRRDNGVVITLACGEPEETCFCSTFGIDAVNPAGDISAWIADGVLYWKSLTEKGNALTDRVKGLFGNTDASDEKKLDDYKENAKRIIEKLPLKGLSLKGFGGEALNDKFSSPKWKELSDTCLGCGTCTFVCPTCQCYDIRDYDTGHGVQRFRCWDSCMYSDFTKMAHGNPRTSQLERFRQRFMHKLVYFPANNDGTYACVGCGRCLAKCPVSMNIVKVAKTVGVKENV